MVTGRLAIAIPKVVLDRFCWRSPIPADHQSPRTRLTEICLTPGIFQLMDCGHRVFGRRFQQNSGMHLHVSVIVSRASSMMSGRISYTNETIPWERIAAMVLIKEMDREKFVELFNQSPPTEESASGKLSLPDPRAGQERKQNLPSPEAGAANCLLASQKELAVGLVSTTAPGR